MPRFIKKEKVKIPSFSYQNCIAKTTTENKPGISVYQHCRNVGEVAKALISKFPKSKQAFFPEDVPIIAALHDIGKVSPGFQKHISQENVEKECPELAKLYSFFETNHAAISQEALKLFLDNKKSEIPNILGSHHGSRSQNQIFINKTECGGKTWNNERNKLIRKLLSDFSPLQSNNLSPAMANIIAGLVCVADWIGSDETFFPAEKGQNPKNITETAKRAVEECGWIFPPLKKDLTFENIFNNQPYENQKLFFESVTKPGVYIFEEQMGAGKTEAALYAAYNLISKGYNTGIYFGLPTKLTSNKIHERVQAFLDKIYIEKNQAILAHGSAWLQAGGKEFLSGNSWFNPRKRSLLAPFAVGTIDQALMSVINVKHFFVRAFGLAGKVVILDEVHSYDVYTGTILDSLVEILREIGCTVIILSATLTKDRVSTFIKNKFVLETSFYPLISLENETETKEIECTTPVSKKINIKILENNVQEIANLAVEKALNKNCVLLITNTVATAQKYYDAVKSSMIENDFPVGLLHSKFPAFKRQQLEEYWINVLGKDGERPGGCVLVATQVVEQSVDIDADFMITELAPTDMMLQRIGRLWRHNRQKRPIANAEICLLCGNIDAADDENSLLDILGISHKIYAPYILWKTYQVWKNRTDIVLPNQIRQILELTYQRNEDEEPDFIKNVYNGFLQKKEKLRLKANAVDASVTSLPTLNDDENATTRLIDQPQIDCLIVRNIDSKGNEAVLELLSGDEVKVSAYDREFSITKKLHQNIVSVPSYKFKEVKTPKFLVKHFFGNIALLKLVDDDLFLNNNFVDLKYTDEKGIINIKSDKNNFPPENNNYESDW